MTNGQGVAKFIMLFQHLSGGTEDSYEKPVTVGILWSWIQFDSIQFNLFDPYCHICDTGHVKPSL